MNHRPARPPFSPVLTIVTIKATSALMPPDSKPVWISRQRSDFGFISVDRLVDPLRTRGEIVERGAVAQWAGDEFAAAIGAVQFERVF